MENCATVTVMVVYTCIISGVSKIYCNQGESCHEFYQFYSTTTTGAPKEIISPFIFLNPCLLCQKFLLCFLLTFSQQYFYLNILVQLLKHHFRSIHLKLWLNDASDLKPCYLVRIVPITSSELPLDCKKYRKLSALHELSHHRNL